jgi:hypothetical protein
MGSSEFSKNSLYFEKLVEHRFISDIMTYCWHKKGVTLEIIHAEIDINGYDLIISYKNTNRYIQLKTTDIKSKTYNQNFNSLILNKENPCIIWILRSYDNNKNDYDFSYLFWGSDVKKSLPDIEKYKTAKQNKPNLSGKKEYRKNIKIIPKKDFIKFNTIEKLFNKLFLVKADLRDVDISVGYNMYTVPSSINKSELRVITKEHLQELTLTVKEKECMELDCNIDKYDLIGKYFDKSGNIYYLIGKQMNQFKLRIGYFKKIYG